MALQLTIVLNDELAEMVGWIQGTSEAYEAIEAGEDPFDAEVTETDDGEFEAAVSFDEEVVGRETLSLGVTKLVVVGLLTLNDDDDVDPWAVAERIVEEPVDRQNEVEAFEPVRDAYYGLWG